MVPRLRRSGKSPGSSQHNGDGKPRFREKIEALRFIPPYLRLVWQTHPRFLCTTIGLRLIRAVTPVATLWIGKLIIDTVIAMRASSADPRRLWEFVALEIGIVIAGEFLARASSLVESLLGDLVSNRTSILLMEHASSLDLSQFEDPGFYDKLERARRQTTNRIGLLAEILGMGQDGLTLASLGIALFVYNPWLLLLLTLAVLPGFLGETHFAALEYSLLYRYTPERRRLDYLRYAGASDETAKEVQLYGLAPWLIDRYRKISSRFYEENKSLSLRKGLVSSLLSLVGTAGYYSAYVVILINAVAGRISVGSLTFLAGSFARSRDLIQRLLLGASDIYEQSLYLKDLFDFFATTPSITSRPGAAPVPNPILTGFVFEDVGFCYPGTDRWALRHVNLRLAPEQRFALVGENGAGKTTLTKLLARLYDPTEGRILLDGIDLRTYNLASVRKAIGVVFQDFVQYDLRFEENIGVGEIDHVRGHFDEIEERQSALSSLEGKHTQSVATPSSIVAAAEKSLASSLLDRLGNGYEQMLGRRFEGGVELSGGEWQKIAIARAYMRDAQVIILDEPTAALDARAEFEVFTRFASLARGKMAVIISHRFSTVRMAEHIFVLQHGTITEEGDHDSLLAHNGLYAELFTLQAKGYR